jgi:11-cis-retinol dehydrogenase
VFNHTSSSSSTRLSGHSPLSPSQIITMSHLWSTLILLSIVYYLFYRYLFTRGTRPIRGLTVLISGCDSGLGRDLALHLSSLGMIVYASCLTPSGVASLTSLPSHPSLHPFLLDVTSLPSLDAAVTLLTPLLPSGLDCLINNAGVFHSFVTELTPLSVYQRSMAVNFLGVVSTTTAFLPLLRLSSSGRVVSISSFAGFSSAITLSAYSASKHALEGWHDSVRGEVRSQGVQCTLIQPGTMRTGMLREVEKGWRQVWQEGTDEVKQHYEGVMDAIPTVQHIMQAMSCNTRRVVTVIEGSLRSVRAASRYRVGWDSEAMWWWSRLPIPDEWRDALIHLMLNLPNRPRTQATETVR